MKNLELDLVKIAQLEVQKDKENFDFRAFLKSQDLKKVDKIVHRLNNEITALIDCQKCGNCCKSLKPGLTEPEIERLAEKENLTPAAFVSRFTENDILQEIPCLRDTPCKYLKDKRCSIYLDRPEDCKSYPHTHLNGLISRTLQMIDNYGICPIVFNLFEELKMELNFNRKGGNI